MSSKPLPGRLYRYRKHDDTSIGALKDRQLFFASPTKLNDPFDCPVEHLVRMMSETEYQEVLGRARKDPHYSKSFEGMSEKQTRDYLMEGAFARTKEAILKLFGNRGVCSFSSKVDNLLMWAHYSDAHKGFCLEFDTTIAPFNDRRRIHPVTYREDYPAISFADVDGKRQDIMERALYSKSLDWLYEDEWRAIYDTPDKLHAYPPAALSGVFFGLNMATEHKREIASILEGTPTKLYEMKRAQHRYALECVELSPVDWVA